jgi:hypothetical protein
MGWLSSLRRRAAVRSRRGDAAGGRIDDATVQYLSEFIQTHRGVEAFVEPQTVVTQTTLLLIAHDGEWTRRRVPSPEWAHSFAEQFQIPGYDAPVVGYPQRMRDYNHRQRIEARRRSEGN